MNNKIKIAIAALTLAGSIMAPSPTPVLSYSPKAAEKSITLYDENANKSLQPGVIIENGKTTYTLPGIPSKNPGYYPSFKVNLGGKALSQQGLIINNILCVPVRAFFSAVGATVSYNSSTRTVTVSHNGLYLTATDGGYVIYANDRPIFNFTPNVIMSNGRMYAPLESLLKIVGMSASREDSLVSVSGAYKPLRSAKNFYRDDEVLWLSRIITAEAKGESLIGQIAVGNVIMNRVGSSLYPDTIYGVIFDRKYGVQFSPVLDGSIYNTPTYTATLAAKIILEGTRLSEDSLFFLNPTTAESNWIVKNREYLYTIGGHDFYR